MAFLHKIIHKITEYQDVCLLCLSMREHLNFIAERHDFPTPIRATEK